MIYFNKISLLQFSDIQEKEREKEEQCANFKQMLLEKEEEIMELQQVLHLNMVLSENLLFQDLILKGVLKT